MLKSHPLLFLVAMLTLSACAKVNAYRGTAEGTFVQHRTGLAQITLSSENLSGFWTTSCTSPAKDSYYISNIGFQNNIMTLVTDSYADSGCKIKVTKEVRYSDYTLNQASDSTKLTETLRLLQYTPMSDAMAAHFNQVQFCGLKSWSTSMQMSFSSAHACAVDAVSIHNTAIYGGTSLYLDDCTDANVASTGNLAACKAVHYFKTTGLPL